MAIPLNRELEAIINSQFNFITNHNLLFTRYIRGWSPEWSFDGPQKGEHMASVINVKGDDKAYKSFFARWEIMLKAIGAVRLEEKIQWRLIVGLGTGSVLETSMTLHHILGVPYIPGSAVKGIVRSYYINKNFERYTSEWHKFKQQNEKQEKKCKKLENHLEGENPEFLRLFGSEGKKGEVIFIDAYPTKYPRLEMDVMNPHYSGYYMDGKAPADYLLPIPVKFVTVARDEHFIFSFKTEDETLEKLVEDLLKEALSNSGIGAKTAVGYGYFNHVKTFYPEPETSSQSAKEAQASGSPAKPPVHKPVVVQPLARYQKNENELKDEFMNPDGAMKSEEEYKRFIEAQEKQYKSDDRRAYEKARKWFEKRKQDK